MRRVVITGIGTINPLGNNCCETCNSLRNGIVSTSEITAFDTSRLKVRKAAQVKDYQPDIYFQGSELTFLDKLSQFALIATDEAIVNSNLNYQMKHFQESCAIILGVSNCGETTRENEFLNFFCKNKDRTSPLSIIKSMANAPVCHISIKYGISGPSYCISSACASSNHAIINSYQLIKNGVVDYAITGGTEASITLGMLKAWESLGVLSMSSVCRPFSSNRDGIVLGEGATIFILESLESAKSREAKILAEIVGVGMSSDATSITRPSIQGPYLSMRQALASAGVNTLCVDYINAHGTGTIINDQNETAAIEMLFGGNLRRLSISSTKSMHGHLLGASGSIELLACIDSINESYIPPTVGFLGIDPMCGLDYTPNKSREKDVTYALSNSFAFGGINTSVLISKPSKE